MTTHKAEMDRVSTALLESQLRRIDRYWERFEETSEERWLTAATEADAAYLRMRDRQVTAW